MSLEERNPRTPEESGEKRPVSWFAFLRDVFICSLGAYGGPEAHMSVFLDQLVRRKNYVTEADLIELIALCSILPGPTSTQTIVAVGYKTGGPLLALLTMVVWAFPALTVMTILSFLYRFLAMRGISPGVLRYVGPMAVGFIVVAAVRIGRKVVTDLPTLFLMFGAALTTYFFREPWIFPVLLILGGGVSVVVNREPGMWNPVRVTPPWRYLLLFVLFALGGVVLARLTSSKLALLFEGFYRYGYLVFGGGQVVVPLMHGDLVHLHRYMTSREFLTGYGLVQGLPGPMFSFAAYAGGLAARGGSTIEQGLAAVVGGVGIFLPGLLLIYFVYPVWEDLKGIKAVRISLRGINAVAGGLIAVAAMILLREAGFYLDTVLVATLTAGFLAFTKVPAPLIVAAALAAGFVL